MNLDRPPSSVLIAEDEAIVALDLRGQLQAHGYTVAALVGRSDEVIPAVQAHRPSVVLMDVRLRGPVDGVTLAEEIFVCEDTPIVFLSAFSDRDIVSRAAQSGAYGYLTKPVTIAALVSTIEMAICKHEDLRRRRQEAEWLGGAIDAVDFAVIGLEPNGDVRFMNRAARAIAGRSLLDARSAPPPWARQIAALPDAVVHGEVVLDFGMAGAVRFRAFKYPVSAGGHICMLRMI